LEGTTASFSSLAFRFEQKLLHFIGRWVFSLITWPIQACLLAGCLSRQLVQQEDDARGKTIYQYKNTNTITIIIFSRFLKQFNFQMMPSALATCYKGQEVTQAFK
jgi:hypothetical protein